MNTARTIELRDVGPVTRLDIVIPDGGGVVVLRGVNGSGKSHALVAVGALVGSGTRPVSRDGAPGAYVEGLGARLTVGRRSTVAGELEVSALDGEDPSLLVDPGIKTADAADAERIKALLRLSRTKLDATAFAGLVGGDERLRELCRESSLEAKDVPSMAASIKRDIEAAARKAESEGANLLAKSAGVGSTLKELQGSGSVAVEQPSAAAAREAHSEAIRAQAGLKATREQQLKLQSAGAAAQRALDSLGEDGSAEAVIGAENLLFAEQEKTRAADLGVQRAQEALEAARAALTEARSVFNAAQAREAGALAEVKLQARQAEQRKQLHRAIAEAEGIPDFDDGALAAASEAVARARIEMDAWVIRERTDGLRAEVTRLEQQGLAATNEGAVLRAAARGTEGIVLDAVRAVCGDGMELHDGRLYVRTDRGAELFSDLSHGERWRIALDIAVKAVGTEGLLVVRQEAWESLDPDNRRAVSEHARKLGVAILTAEADDGEIRAEVA